VGRHLLPPGSNSDAPHTVPAFLDCSPRANPCSCLRGTTPTSCRYRVTLRPPTRRRSRSPRPAPPPCSDSLMPLQPISFRQYALAARPGLGQSRHGTRLRGLLRRTWLPSPRPTEICFWLRFHRPYLPTQPLLPDWEIHHLHTSLLSGPPAPGGAPALWPPRRTTSCESSERRSVPLGNTTTSKH